MLEATKARKRAYKLIIFDWEGTLAKGGNTLIEGVKDLLELLVTKNFTCAIATSMPLSRLQDSIMENELQSYFSHLQAADCGANKPDPKMLLELLHHLSFRADEAVMIGDSIYDLIMAQKAQVDAIGVLSGSDTKEHLLTAAPQAILETVNDLSTYLNLV